MQTAFDLGQANALILVRDRLRRIFGQPREDARLEPVGQMVRSLLGARTYDAVSWAAYRRLIAHFPNWTLLAAAKPEEIEQVISDVTFAEKKAVYIGSALRMLRARAGDHDLEFLRDWSVDDALFWLEQLCGVGRKVAAATLNFSTLGKAALVIDTHVLRVLKRSGFVRPGADTRDAYRTMMESLRAWSADELTEFHATLKRLGQTICRHEAQACAICPLQELCPSARPATDARRAPEGMHASSYDAKYTQSLLPVGSRI